MRKQINSINISITAFYMYDSLYHAHLKFLVLNLDARVDLLMEVICPLALNVLELLLSLMVISVHENGNDVNHHLSDQNVEDAEYREVDCKSTVANQVVNRFH